MVGPGSRPEAAHDTPPRMPRRVRVAAIVVGVLLLVFVVLPVTGIAGQHGPARHFSGAGPASLGVATGAVTIPAARAG